MDADLLSNWRKNFAIFLSGQFFSGITSMTVQYAIIWYLTKETGSATVLSFATLLGMIPMIVLSPFAGPLIDRWNKKVLLIVTDFIVAAFALILSLVGGMENTFPLWLVFVSLFVRSVGQTFQSPTIQSIVPTIVPTESITRVNGQLGMVNSANYIIAPALGAFLYAAVPLQYLILLDVFGAIVGSGLLLLVKIPHQRTTREKVHFFKDAKFGVTQLKSRKGLWQLMMIGMLFSILYMPAASLYPLMTMSYFKGTVGNAGLIEVVYAGGMLLGGAVIGVFGKWKNRMTPIFVSYVVIGVMTGASGFLPGNHRGFIWFVIFNSLAGLATPFFNTLLMAMIQQSYPPEYLGRVLGILNSLMSITGPVGLIFAGPLADKIGVETLFIIAGAGTLLCGFLNYLAPKARNYDLDLQQELADKM